MSEYHKINSLYLRDPATKNKKLLIGQYADPAFEYLADNAWIFTEKVDGTNIRVMIADESQDGKAHGIVFGGKTEAASIPATLVQRLQERFHTDEQRSKIAKMFPDGACLYGEGYGAKIQSGGNYRPDQDFVLFDVKVGDFWLERENIVDVADLLGLDVVPVVGTGPLSAMESMVQAGFASKWGSAKSEGIVARPAVELKTRNGQRIITKLKFRDF